MSPEKAAKIADYRRTLADYDRRRARLNDAIRRIETQGGSEELIAATVIEFEKLEQLWALLQASRHDPDFAAVLLERDKAQSAVETPELDGSDQESTP